MILELENISKIYPGVVALDQVSLQFEAGEVHALMGENGAGKSTLIKVVAGAITPNGGIIKVGGGEYAKMSPKLAKDNGIAVIYQDINLIQPLSVAENIFFGSHKGKLFSKKETLRIGTKNVRRIRIPSKSRCTGNDVVVGKSTTC